MNKIEAMTTSTPLRTTQFTQASRAFMKTRTARRTHDTTLSTEEAYLADRLEAAYDRLMLQLGDVEGLLSRYAAMTYEEQVARVEQHEALTLARRDTLAAIDQAIHLVGRVYTHLNGFFDPEYTDEDQAKGEAISVAAIECFQRVADYALDCSMERHQQRHVEFLDRDEAQWAILPDSVADYTDEDFERLAAEDALYED